MYPWLFFVRMKPLYYNAKFNWPVVSSHLFLVLGNILYRADFFSSKIYLSKLFFFFVASAAPSGSPNAYPD